MQSKMDFEKRRKKSDKAKEKFDKHGGFSQKHVRLAEILKLKENPTKKKERWRKNSRFWFQQITLSQQFFKNWTLFQLVKHLL
jgi:general stress protein 26